MHLLRSSLIVITMSMAVMAHLHADAHVEEVAPLPDKDAFVTVVVPDLRQTLGRIESIVHGFSPKMPTGMLTTGLGAMFNDPLLTNLGKGPVVAIVSAGVPIPSFAILVPALDAQKYVDAAANYDMIMSKVVGNLAVIAQSPDGAALGERLAGTYAQFTAKPLSADLRIALAPGRLASAYGPFLSAMMAMQLGNLPTPPPGAGAPAMSPEQIKHIVMLEIAALMEVSADVDVVQTDLSLSDAAIRLDQSIAAKPGSLLAKALVAPVTPVQPLAKRYPADKATIVLKGKTVVMPWIDYCVDLLARLKNKPEGKDLQIDAVVTDLKTYAAPYTGEIAGRFGADDKGQISYDAVIGVTDQALAQKSVEGAADATRHLNEALGLPKQGAPGSSGTMLLTKNVRTVGGLPVSRVSFSLDDSVPNAAILKKFMKDREVVISKDAIITATDPHQLDILSASPGPGLQVSAEKVMGGGRDAYLDVNLAAFFSLVVKNGTAAEVPGVQDFAKALDAAPAGEPVTWTYTANDGRGRTELRIPLAPFYFTAQKIQQEQGGGDAAPGGDDVKPKDKASVF